MGDLRVMRVHRPDVGALRRALQLLEDVPRERRGTTREEKNMVYSNEAMLQKSRGVRKGGGSLRAGG